MSSNSLIVLLSLCFFCPTVISQYYYTPDTEGCVPTYLFPHPWQISASQTWYPLITLDGAQQPLSLEKAYVVDTMSRRRYKFDNGKEVDVEFAGIPIELKYNDVAEYGAAIFRQQYIDIFLGVNYDIYGIALQGGFVNETTRINGTVTSSEFLSSWIETYMVSYSHDGGRNFHQLKYDEFDETVIFHANHDSYAKSEEAFPVPIRTGNLRIHPTHVSVDAQWARQALARIALIVCRPRLTEKVINSASRDSNVFVPLRNPGGGYGSGYRIRWRIKVREGEVIKLRLVSQHMITSPSCYTSYLAVYDGLNAENEIPSPLLFKTCGILKRHKVIESSGPNMEVVFESHDRHDQSTSMFTVVGARTQGCGKKRVSGRAPTPSNWYLRDFNSGAYTPYWSMPAPRGGKSNNGNNYDYSPSDRHHSEGQPYQNHFYYRYHQVLRDEQASVFMVRYHLQESAANRERRRSRRSTRHRRLAMSSSTSHGDWPWNVRILKATDGVLSHHCGGVLIHPLWVVTAAHCLFRNPPTALFLQTMDNRILRAERFFVNPRVGVGPPKHPISHDIGLVRLETTAHLSSSVNPICLPDMHYEKGDASFDPASCSFTGFGTIGAGGTIPVTLQEVRQPNVLATHVCQGFWIRTSWIDKGGEICLGGQWDGRGYLCPGDSGSPYSCRNKQNDKWYLQATSGWVNQNCNENGYPSILLRTHKYVEWIKIVMASYFDAMPEGGY